MGSGRHSSDLRRHLAWGLGIALALGIAVLVPSLRIHHYSTLYRPAQVRQEGYHHFVLDLTDAHPEWHIDRVGHQPRRWEPVAAFEEPVAVPLWQGVPDFQAGHPQRTIHRKIAPPKSSADPLLRA